jgi:hypothetical protein
MSAASVRVSARVGVTLLLLAFALSMSGGRVEGQVSVPAARHRPHRRIGRAEQGSPS